MKIAGALPSKRKKLEELWLQFFADPSKWWDNRWNKADDKYPDFKHTDSGVGLWLDSKSNPPWVKWELNKLAPRSIKSNNLWWNSKLAQHVKAGRYDAALDLFKKNLGKGMIPDSFTFGPVINACTRLQSIEEGRRLHNQIRSIGCKVDTFVNNALVDMYVTCGMMEEACKVFKSMPSRNVISWNAIILGYAKFDQLEKAMNHFAKMQLEGLVPGTAAIAGVLNACARVGAYAEGRNVHGLAIQCDRISDVIVASSLIDMYLKCGHPKDARSTFDRMPIRNVVSWNSMILGYVKCGEGHEALTLYHQMEQANVKPDRITFTGVLNACASVEAIEIGRRIHEMISQTDCKFNIIVLNSLIDMYAKCGCTEEAWKVFTSMAVKDVVSWNGMLLGLLKCGEAQSALDLYRQMEHEGIEPSRVTFVTVLRACTSLLALEEGCRLHRRIIELGLESDHRVGSSLVDMYAKCGLLEEASTVFSKMPSHDVFAWNSVIMGHIRCGQCQKALELYNAMQVEGVKPDTVTFVGLLNACAAVAALGRGRALHKQIIQSENEFDVFVGSTLVDMYAKCGSLEDSVKVFRSMRQRSVASWNAMLGGYAMHGKGCEALGHFLHMCQEEVPLSGTSFAILLSACSHAGLVDEGLHHFGSMGSAYGVTATVEHYACMVDLLGRAGRLHEAEDLLSKTHFKNNQTMLMSLLGACKVHGNLEMGESTSKLVRELDPQNASSYVLLSSIYAAAGKWDSRAQIHRERMARGVRKEPGRTWIEICGKTHSFIADEQSHPQMPEIRKELKKLTVQMIEAGYKPDFRSVFHDVSDDEKLSRLGSHSERLAIVLGLISTPPKTEIRIFKNLRICGDCHTAIEIISKMTGRYFIVRDSNRFHHFQDGSCSCKQYW